jgi:hypothetical protein
MVLNQRPSVTTGSGFFKNPSQPLNKSITILIVHENFASLDSTGNNVVKRTGSVYASLAGIWIWVPDPF